MEFLLVRPQVAVVPTVQWDGTAESADQIWQFMHTLDPAVQVYPLYGGKLGVV